MSEETGPAEDGQEPSMEDILASIRRILSENDEAKIAAVEAELHPEAGSGGDIESSELPAENIALDEGKSDTKPVLDSDLGIDKGSVSQENEGLNLDAEPNLGVSAPQDPSSIPPVMESILDLTPEMIASEIISEPTAQTSTDVLSELAAAILDRRDMAVDASSQDMTLEGIVREMLKPILREWLDRNLPYLIERLVKREIDLMVNRAERLEE